MPRNTRPWTVTPHTPLLQVQDNLWTVESQIPGLPMDRRMGIIRRTDGKLLFYHAIPLDDATLAQVKALGEPAFLVIGHDAHGIDAAAFKTKLGLKLYGPKVNLEKMKAKFDVDGALEDIPADPAVQVLATDGTKIGDAMVVVTSKNGAVSMLFSDAVMNVKHGKFSMRLMGFLGGPKSPAIFKMFFVNDKKALKAFFERLAAYPRVDALIPCHGEVVNADCKAVLSRLAEAL